VSALKFNSFLYILPAACMGLILAGCGGPGESSAPIAPAREDAAVVATDPAADASAAQAAKEAELARLEADMSLKEREAELARREAELAARQKAESRPAAAPKPTANAPAAKQPAPAAIKTYVVPAGTQLSVRLMAPVSTKTAQIGDNIDGQLTTDVIVDGKTLVPTGSAVHGSVTEVVSGSNKIGGTPTLGITFDALTLKGTETVAISGHLIQQGKSDTARDTAKIAGGALVGAVIGNKIDNGTGKIVGGIVGGAAGAAVAQKTGTEVELPSGTVVGFLLDNSFEVTAQ
jgi:hypothetical protein